MATYNVLDLGHDAQFAVEELFELGVHLEPAEQGQAAAVTLQT
jgi:hypothetical protein